MTKVCTLSAARKRLLFFVLLLASCLGVRAQNRSGFLRESFEGRTFPPAGWLQQSVTGTTQWGRGDFFASEDTASALILPEWQANGEDWLIMPRFRVAANDSLVFWYFPILGGTNPDSLSVKISTTDSALTSFTRTLALFENNRNYPTGWYDRIKLDLSRYAGQRVYIAFKHVNNDGSGISIDDVELGQLPAADVRVHHFTLPSAPVVGTSLVPKVTVQNMGAAPQTFSVTMTIAPGSYSSTRSVTIPAGREEREVAFAAWTPPAIGQYTYSATATLAADAQPTDNTIAATRRAYNPLALSPWQHRASLPEARSGHGLTSYRSPAADTTYVLSVGGADANNATDGRVYRYSNRTRAWTARAPMPVPRAYCAAHTIRDRVYVAGGVDWVFLGTPSDRLNIYDPRLNTWTTGAPLPTANAAYGSGVLGDSLLYLVAGTDANRNSNAVHVYNPRLDTWAAATPFPGTPVYSLGMGLVGNTIVTLGGVSGNYNSAEAWRGDINPANPLQITWTRLPNHPTGAVRYMGAAGAEVGGTRRVYFSGGALLLPRGVRELNPDTWAFDLTSNEWVLTSRKPNGVQTSQLAAVTIADSVYLAYAGGLAQQANGSYASTNANEWLPLGRNNVVLSVALTSFSARRQGEQVVLEWQTAQEKNNAGFELSVSTDGRLFRPLATVPAGGGHSSAARHYRYLDAAPGAHGVRYYRLVQRDFDGTAHHLGVRSVALDNQASALAVAPNPFGHNTSAWVTLPVGAPVPVTLSLTDAAGRLCWQRQTTASGSFRVEDIGGSLKPGLYVLRCRAGKQDMRVKVVKQ